MIEKNSNFPPNFLDEAKEIVNQRIDDAIEMLDHLENQYRKKRVTGEEITSIFTKARETIQTIKQEVIDSNTAKELSDGKTKSFAKRLKQADRRAISVITQHTISFRKALAENITRFKDNQYINKLITGGISAIFVRFLAFYGNEEAKSAVDSLKRADEKMRSKEAQEEKNKVGEDLSAIHQRRLEHRNDQNELKKRSGVIGLAGIFTFQQSLFSNKETKKQLNAYRSQKLSDQERVPLKSQIKIKQKTFDNTFVPLNNSFDPAFGAIAGDGGISSTNQLEGPHLVNAWEVKLKADDAINFRSIRHGITSDRAEKNPQIRLENSEKAAKELVMAALLQELSDRNLSLETASTTEINLSLNSVSLVTVDDLLPLITKKGHSEKEMFRDQWKALKAMEKLEFIEISGIKIPVKIQVNSFNFGVNEIAKKNLGIAHQYNEYNQLAHTGFSDHYENFLIKRRDLISAAHRNKQAAHRNKQSDLQNSEPELKQLMKQIKALNKDISKLMKNKKAYLQGNNQYELGAKILIMSHLMDRMIQKYNRMVPVDKQQGGYKSAFNCKSGKDRTGMMSDIAEALTIYASLNEGAYPSHEELQAGQPANKQFTAILAQLIEESQSIEITKINTGARGYKLSATAARVADLSSKEYDGLFKRMVGLSRMVAS